MHKQSSIFIEGERLNSAMASRVHKQKDWAREQQFSQRDDLVYSQKQLEQGTKSRSPSQVVLHSSEKNTNEMCQKTSEIAVNTVGPCPKASESAALMVLREHLRLNLLGMEQIILFDLWSNDRDTIEAALKKMSDLCSEKKDVDATNNRAAFQLVNGCGIILAVMRQWRHDRKIQSLCCLVILNTTDGVDPKYIAGIEVVDAVTLAMKMYPTFFPVQLCGCGALAGICQNKTNVDHLVRNRQGIETIVNAMQRYPNTNKLQLWANLCLQNILNWEDFRKAFLDIWVRVTVDDAFLKMKRTPLCVGRPGKTNMGISPFP